MLTRPEVDEAEAKIALIYFSQILHFGPIFSRKRNFRSIFDGTSKISAQNGRKHENFLVNTPKMTSYVLGRMLLVVCVHIE